MRRPACLGLMLASLLAVTSALAADVHVDASAGDDAAGDGSAGAPVRTITRATEMAGAPGDVIRIAPGRHDVALGEIFPINVRPGVSVVGAGPDLTLIEGTYPSRTDFPRPPLLRVEASGGPAGDVLVSGLAFRGGHSGLVVATSSTGPSRAVVAGCLSELHVMQGIQAVARHPEAEILVERCVVRDADYRGIDASASGRVIVRDNLVERCGAGLSIFSNTVLPFDVDVQRNEFVGGSEGVDVYGSSGCRLTAVLTQNVIRGNSAVGVSATSYFDFASGTPFVTLVAERNVIAGNDGPGVKAECLYTDSVLTADLAGNLVVGNAGPGVRVDFYRTRASLLRSTNDTIAFNDVGLDGGSLLGLVARNDIVWGNLAAQVTGEVSVTDSDVQGSGGLGGNLDVDPLFRDPPGGDYRLSRASPCIDAARGDLVPPTDLDGRSRPLDDPDAPNTATAFPTGADLGAYESANPSIDHDGDGLTEDEGDCLEGNAGERLVPREITGLRVGLDRATASVLLSWDDAAPTAGSAVTYEVVAGPLGPGTMDPVEPYRGASCVGTPAAPLLSAEGTADRWFLVRGLLPACGAGSFGEAGLARDALDAASPCR